MTVTKEQIAELKAKAEAATPGPWWAGDGSRESHYEGPYQVLAKLPDGDTLSLAACNTNFRDQSDKDGAFIAAANPQVVLQLLSRIEELEAALDEIRCLGTIETGEISVIAEQALAGASGKEMK